jgi:hypothetical protein
MLVELTSRLAAAMRRGQRMEQSPLEALRRQQVDDDD